MSYMSNPHVLIDARNLLYRSYYANLKGYGKPVHHITVAFRFIRQWIDKFKPQSVSVFWDPSGELWRHKLLENYKDRDRGTVDGARAALKEMEPIMRDIFHAIGAYQFLKPTQEADDLIYAACRTLAPAETVILSSDNDYGQVAFRMPHVQLYDPMKNVFKTYDYDPAVKKALMGDKSDTINGYFKIGDVKSERMARSLTELGAFLDEKGRSIFLKNMLLIDLSLCPKLLANIIYVQGQYAKPGTYNNEAAMSVIRQHKLTCLMEEYDKLLSPFKAIVENSEKG